MKRTSVTLKFPKELFAFINNIKSIDFDGEKMIDFIDHLDNTFGNVKARILENDGQLRPYINIYVGSQNIASLQGLETIVPQGERISLLLSRAGG